MNRPPLKSLVHRWTIALAVILVANVVAFVVWTAPTWNTTRGAAGSVNDLERARQSIEPRLERARETSGRVVAARNDLETFRGALLTTGGSELMDILVEAGTRAGISLDDASFQYAEVGELGVVQLLINLPISGPYASVRRLLDEFSAIPAFVVIEGVGMTAARDNPRGGDQAPIIAEVALSVFLDDPALAEAFRESSAGPGAGGATATRQAPAIERLLAVRAGTDPRAISSALDAVLSGLPPLPVDADALVLNLEALEHAPETGESTRNLFATYEPPPPVVERPARAEPEPEEVERRPTLPVRLLGIVFVEGQWHASLADDLGVYVLTEGDSLPNGVEIIDVGADYAEVEYRGDRTRLSLEGN